MEEKMKNILNENEVGAILVTNKYDITYVSKFTGYESYILLTNSKNYIIVDKRYFEQAKKQSADFTAVLYEKNQKDLMNIINKLLMENEVSNLGVDICHTTYSLYKELAENLKEIEIVELEEPFKKYRDIKSKDEIIKIQKASEIADKSYYRMLQMISEGMSEKDIEIELEYTIKREGGDGYAFRPIIGAGSKSSMPYSWADKNVFLRKGDILLLNYGVKWESYTAALARMVAIGNIKEEYKEIYKNAFNVYSIILEYIKPNMKYEELYKIFTESIKKSKYKEYYLESIGHSRGIQTIEGNLIRPDVKKTIMRNEIYSIGVSIAVPGIGGARLEDAVLIKETSVEILTNSVRNLLNI